MKYVGFILAVILAVVLLQVHQSSKQSVERQRKHNAELLAQNRRDLQAGFESQEEKLQELEERFAAEKVTTRELQQKYAALVERRKQLKTEIEALVEEIDENRELVSNFAANRQKYIQSIKKAQDLLTVVEDDIQLLQNHLKRVTEGWEQ